MSALARQWLRLLGIGQRGHAFGFGGLYQRVDAMRRWVWPDLADVEQWARDMDPFP